MAEQLGPKDAFMVDNEQPIKDRLSHARIIENQIVDPKTYELDDSFKPYDGTDPKFAHTTHEIARCLEKGTADIDARVLEYSKDYKSYRVKRYNKESFLKRYRESFDGFASDDGGSFANAGLVGDDFVPILGGPFNKQLYIYDYLKMNQACFWAYHHDPIARCGVRIIKDFTLGRGYRIDFEDETHQAYWEAFEEANEFPEMMDYIAIELSLYGENMLWWLPDHETEINYRRSPNDVIKHGLIPRIRVIDPSVIWEIITHPEDINSPLAYQWVSPTQYQIYSHVNATNETVQSQKFIYQQLPADRVLHTKVNTVSNEKRGRSDLFPALGYLKRLRDSVNYQVLSLQKNSAWSIDTEIDGNQTDIDNYASSQAALGTIAPAGSEFIHSKHVKRTYLANQGGGKGGNSAAFEWCLSMAAAAMGIPQSYFGTHLSGGQTRASAIVATEPVAKLFEARQLKYERIMRKVINRYFRMFGIKDPVYEITFPEVITQDRSQKLKDLALAEMQKWISPERAATIASKELQVTEYDYMEEMEKIQEQQQYEPAPAPLTSEPGLNSGVDSSDSAVTGEQRNDIKDREYDA